MQSKEQMIEEVRKAIKETEKQYGAAEAVLGSKLFSNADPALLESNKAYNDVKNLNREISQCTGTINLINSNQEKIKDFLNKKKEYSAEIEKLTKENYELYESIGKVFYNAYKSGDIDETKYSEIFTPVSTKEEKISQIRDELNELERSTKDKNFIKMVMDSGKKTVLLGNLSLQQKAMQKDLQKAGEKICLDGLVEAEKGIPLVSAVEPYLKNQETAASLTEQKRLVEGEIEKLNQKILELSEGSKSYAKIEELEAKIEDFRNTLEIQNRNLAQGAVKSLDRKLLSAFSTDLENLDSLKVTLDNQHRELDSLIAALEADRLERKINDMNLRIRSLEDNIKRQQEEIKRHKREISKAQKEMEALTANVSPPKPEA